MENKAQVFSQPFKHWIIDGYVRDLIDLDLDQDWIYYDNDCESKKRTTTNLSLTLQSLLPDIYWLRNLTGLEDLVEDKSLYGAGLHITEPTGHLNCHLDYALHSSGLERRINFILFLNEYWKESFGGAFELYDDSAREVVKRVYPEYGRVIIWESSDIAYHGAEKTSPDSPCRVTLASYYLAPPRPNITRKRALFVPSRS